jgi:hypothetical protein
MSIEKYGSMKQFDIFMNFTGTEQPNSLEHIWSGDLSREGEQEKRVEGRCRKLCALLAWCRVIVSSV